MSKETREMAERIVNKIAVGAWQFQSRGWVIEAIDKALRARDARAAKIAETPYGDKVQAVAGDEPREVGRKIAAAIRNGVADAK